MVETRLTITYMTILIFFSFFLSGFAIEETPLTLGDFAIVSNTISKLTEYDTIFTNILKVGLIPFMILDIIFLIIGSFVVSFYILPPMMSTLLFTPLGIFATMESILPLIRGN